MQLLCYYKSENSKNKHFLLLIKPKIRKKEYFLLLIKGGEYEKKRST